MAANNVVQNPESVGTALKTLTMYIRAARTEAEQAGVETEGMAESVAKLQQEILALTGVDIMLDADTFKSTYQILQEISEVWDDLTDVSRANVLNLLGGKRNANVLSSLISNFGDAQKAMATASNSAGSALAENEKYLDSIEGKTQKLKASFETMANAIINSDLVKAWIDFQRVVADTVTWLEKAGLLLPTIVSLASAIRAFQTASTAQKAAGGIIDLLTHSTNVEATIEAVKTALGGLGGFGQKLAGQTILEKLSSLDLDDSLSKSIKEIVSETTAATPKLSSFSAIFDSLKTKANGAASVLKSAFSTTVGRVGLAVTGLVTLITIAKNLYNSYVQGVIDRGNEAYTSTQDTISKSTEAAKELDKIGDEFTKLSQGVDRYGNNVSLTDDEYARYLQLVQDIINITPSLQKAYTDKGASLQTGYVDILEKANEEHEKFIKNAKEDVKITWKDTLAGSRTEVNQAYGTGMFGNVAGQNVYQPLVDIFSTSIVMGVTEGSESAEDILKRTLGNDLYSYIRQVASSDGTSIPIDQKAVYDLYQTSEKLFKAYKEAGADTTILGGYFGKLQPYADAYNKELTTIVDTMMLLAEVGDKTSESFARIASAGQSDMFRLGLFNTLNPSDLPEDNYKALLSYVTAFEDIQTRMANLKQASAWQDVTPDINWLKEAYKDMPGIVFIIDMIAESWNNTSNKEKSAADGVNEVIQGYENLEKVLSKISGFNSFLNNARNGKGSEDPFGMISAAKDVADAYNEIVAVSDDIPKIDWTSMVSEVGENGEILWSTSGIEYYIDAIIDAAAANTEFTKNNPEVVAWLQQMAKDFDEAAASAKSLGDAMGSMESIDGLIKRINEYDGDDSEAFDIINELQKFVDEWNKIRTKQELEPIDITTFVSDENGKISFSNTIAALGEFRDAIINDNEAMQELQATSPGLYNIITTMGTQAEDAAKGVLTLEDAISSLGDIASVLQEGIGGDTLADQITNAENLAEGYNSVLRQLGDLDLTDKAADFGWREFLTIDDDIITENKARIQEYYTALVDLVVENMAKLYSLDDSEKSSMKSSLLGLLTSQLDADEVKRKTEEIKDAFSEIKDITSYQADLASYRAGETSYFDMLERMYDLAAQYDDIDLKDLWDFDASAFKDIGDIQLDKMIDKLATVLEIDENEVEDWKNHVKKSFKEAEEAVSEYETATKSINLADSLNGFLADVRSGDKDPLTMLSSAVSLAEDLGVKLEKVVSVGAGGKMTFNTDALTTAFEKYIDDLVKAKKLNADLAAQIKNAARAEGDLAEEARKAAERMAEAPQHMQSLYSFMQSGTAGESDILTVLKSAQEQFETYKQMVEDGLETTPLDIFSFISMDDSGIKENVDTAKKLYADVAEQMVNDWMTEAKKANAGKNGLAVLTGLTGDQAWQNGLTAEQLAWFSQVKELILKPLNDLDAEVEPTVGDIINNLQTLFDFQNKINTGESVDFTSVYDDLENLKTILGDQTLNLGDIIKWQDGDFKYAFDKTDSLNNKIEQYTNNVVTALGLTGDEAVAASNKIKEALGVQDSAFAKINDTITKVKSAGSFSEIIDSFTKGDTSLIDMFSEAASIAEELGLTMDQVWDFDGMRPKAEAVYAAIDKAVEEMAEGRNYSEEFKQQLKEAARYAAETASAQSKVKTAYDSYGSLVSGMTSVGENVELTYERYLNLTEADARYANAIEYMNGQLTINKQRYVEITEAIGQETIAIAQQRIEQIRSSNAYVQYTKEYERYGAQMDATHLAALQNMELEIRGYQTLAAEIRNASTEFAKFLNASDETSGPVYEGMQNARQIIDDTLNNEDSDRYLKTGNEKYQLAYNVLIGENVDVNSSAFDEAFKRVNRYLEDGVSGYNNFVNDLIENNFVDGAGNLSGTVDQMAEKLGVTKDLVRAMLEEAKQYGAEIDWSKIDPEVAEGAAEKTKTIFDTITDLGNALDDIKTNKLDIGADAEAGEIATVNQRLIETEEILNRLNKNKLIFASTDGIPSDAKHQIGQDYIPENYNGNVDLLSRKIIPLKMMVDVGWNVDDSDGWATLFSTTYSGSDFSFTGPEADMIVSVTPITPEGQILSESELGDYVYELFEESQKTGKSIAEIDAQKLNLLIDVDTKQPEESLDAAFDRISEKMMQIHELQEQWDLIRSKFNFFGDGSDPYGVFSGVEEEADSAKESVENLSNTSVNNDTSGAVANIGSVQSAAENATKALDKLDGKTVTATVDMKYTESNKSGGNSIFGDFFSRLFGRSAAGGTHGISNGGRTLVGELGREIVVDTDRGEWYTVGNRGPEFVNLPKNGIVFSNKDTEEILRRGSVAKSNGGRAHSDTGFLGGLIDLWNGIKNGVKSLFTTSGDDVFGTGFKPKDNGKSGEKQGNQLVDETKQLEEVLTELKEAFEEVNNEFDQYIAHFDYDYFRAERANDYDTMLSALQGQADYYRQVYEAAAKAVEEMRAAGADESNEELRSMESNMWDAYENLYGKIDEIRELFTTALTEDIDNLQNAFSNLDTMVEEYNTTGHISTDTFQTIAENGLQYLSLLQDENGEYTISADKCAEILALRREQLAVETAMSYVDQLSEALRNNEVGTVEQLLDLQNKIGDSTWDTVYANLELLKTQGLTEEEYKKALDTINTWRNVSNDVLDVDVSDVAQEIKKITSRIEQLHDAIDDMQSAVGVFETMLDEIGENGYITVDTFQSLLENGIQYLSVLEFENGQYSLNREAIEAIVAAKTEELAIESALEYVNQIKQAAQNGEIDRVNTLCGLTAQLAQNTWDAVYAQLALLQTSEDITEEQYEAARANVEKLQNITPMVSAGSVFRAPSVDDSSSSGGSDEVRTLADDFEDLNEQIEHFIAHQEFMYDQSERARHWDGMAQALINEVGYYKRIMQEAQETLRQLEAQGYDDFDEEIQRVEEGYWEAYRNMYEALDKIRALRVDALRESIDGITSAYDKFKTASEQYNSSGFMTVEVFSDILEGGLQYLAFIKEENGQYVINADSIKQYTEARKEELAIETALQYIGNLREALQNREIGRLDNLIDATEHISHNSWDQVYATAALLKAEGMTAEQYDKVIQNIDRLRGISASVTGDLTAAEDEISAGLDDQKNALDKLLGYVESLIKAETQDRINAIKDEIAAYKEMIDLKKEALDTTKKENEYEKEVADKVQEIAKIQAKLDLMSLDDSRKAVAERAKLAEDLASKQQELSEYQADHSYDLQKEALDQEASAYEESRQTEIDALNDSISSTEKVYQLAIERIRTQWDTLYADLIAWNTEQGSVINDEITAAWEAACNAVKKYGGYVEAVAATTGTGATGDSGHYVIADIPKYHNGGIVDSAGELNDKEVMAVLQKGELVLNDEKKKGLFRVIDFVKELEERLHTSIGNLKNLMPTAAMVPAMAGLHDISGYREGAGGAAITISNNFAVTVQSDNLNPGDARKFGAEMADSITEHLYDAFTKRGITSLSLLRHT